MHLYLTPEPSEHVMHVERNLGIAADNEGMRMISFISGQNAGGVRSSSAPPVVEVAQSHAAAPTSQLILLILSNLLTPRLGDGNPG
jgi:hypothetical protein